MTAGARAESGPPALAPGQALRISRGFSCVFWSLPLLSAAQAAALGSLWPARWALGALAGAGGTLACGFWLLGRGGSPTPRWPAAVRRAALLAGGTLGLGPFLVWWAAAPLQLYFAANAGLQYAVQIAWLAAVNRLAAEWGTGLGDAPLRKEAWAGLGMVLWLSACTVGALAWLFHRGGLLAAGWPAVLAQLADLPREARTLFLLPYAMTAYVAWRAKESGFRRAAETAP